MHPSLTVFETTTAICIFLRSHIGTAKTKPHSAKNLRCVRPGYDAVEFCQRLSRATGLKYRLPSEAEWEYACRAGTETPFHFGETITTDLVNYDGSCLYADETRGVYRQVTTTPVGQFPPNAFGLYDMHGNVWEWCEDHWHSNYDGAPNDGRAWLTDKAKPSRLLRGASCHCTLKQCRSAYRRAIEPSYNDALLGFRLVIDLKRLIPLVRSSGFDINISRCKM